MKSEYSRKMQTVINKFNGLTLSDKKYVVHCLKAWEKIQASNEPAPEDVWDKCFHCNRRIIIKSDMPSLCGECASTFKSHKIGA